MTSGPIVEVLPAARWAGHVAELLADRLAARPGLMVALPTGSTPLTVYEALPAVLRRGGVNAASATVVLLDEYLGLPAGHRARCDETLRRRLLDGLVGADTAGPRFVAFEVDALSPHKACARMDLAIDAAGGLDLVVLGLGANGHVGMNEPGTAADARTRVVELAPSTRDASRGYGATEPPTHGVTLGMATIVAAREIWLLATGAHKQAILAATLGGPVTSAVPASLLRSHPRLRVIADDAAAR